jgi:hypothetical protein
MTAGRSLHMSLKRTAFFCALQPRKLPLHCPLGGHKNPKNGDRLSSRVTAHNVDIGHHLSRPVWRSTLGRWTDHIARTELRQSARMTPAQKTVVECLELS